MGQKFFMKKDKLFNKAFQPVVSYALSLLDDISPKEHYIHDKEICAENLIILKMIIAPLYLNQKILFLLSMYLINMLKKENL